MCKAFLGMGGVVEKRLVIINHENVTSPAGLELTMASHKRVKYVTGFSFHLNIYNRIIIICL